MVTLFGIATEINPLQPENTQFPMEVTLFGMLTDVKPLQFENA